MKHCYIFNYMTNRIYHIEIPEKLFLTEDIDRYLRVNYNLKAEEISYMTSYKELNIEELVL